MRKINLKFSKKAHLQLECLALRRGQTPGQCIRDALSLLRTLPALVDKNGVLTVHSRGTIYKFAV